MAITGNGNASKEQVAAMLESRMKIRLETKYLVATDALAAAVTHLQRIDIGGNQIPEHKYKDWKSFVNANQRRVN